VTVEGLDHPIQDAFVHHDAFQCGYCTPGQLCSAVGMLGDLERQGVSISPAEIREWMSGNICRCGAYPNIVAAIEEVA
jgi:xanthine dehydrogenase YagT iron-sulfur-binding subunit